MEVAAHEVTPLTKQVSYIDTTSVETFVDNRVATAMAQEGNHYGPLLPSVRERIRNAVREHGVLDSETVSLVNAP